MVHSRHRAHVLRVRWAWQKQKHKNQNPSFTFHKPLSENPDANDRSPETASRCEPANRIQISRGGETGGSPENLIVSGEWVFVSINVSTGLKIDRAAGVGIASIAGFTSAESWPAWQQSWSTDIAEAGWRSWEWHAAGLVDSTTRDCADKPVVTIESSSTSTANFRSGATIYRIGCAKLREESSLCDLSRFR